MSDSRQAGTQDSETLKVVQELLDFSAKPDEHHKAGDYMISLMPHIKVLRASSAMPQPWVHFSYTVQPDHCNRLGNLHGGCVATIFDFCTTMPIALVGREGFWRLWGVSRTINTTYLRPAAEGEELLVECEVVHLGKNLASLKGVMRRKRDGAITATCEHGKVNVDPDSKL